jgi:uncharacterized membrane protein YgdD (TMEM256/DUF423 family)
MYKTYLVLGILLSLIAVVLGAFGAHGLKKMVGADTIAIYQTGVQYQMYHAFALLIAGVLYERFQNNLIIYAGIFFLAGIAFFSGSLYAMASLKAMNKSIFPFIGPMTPLGGLFFITGWILLLFGILKK